MWADWDDEPSVIYHRPSGKTHFVNASTAFLLEQFFEGSATLGSATRALAEALGRAADDDLRLAVAGTLFRLEELGLIERA